MFLSLLPSLPPSLTYLSLSHAHTHITGLLQAVVQAMRVIDPPLELEDDANEVHRQYIEGEATATDFDYPPVSRPCSGFGVLYFVTMYSIDIKMKVS